MHGTIEGDVAPDVEEMEYRTDEDHGTTLRRRRVEHGVIAALVVVVLAAIALIGFQSGADEKQDRAERDADAAPATTEAPTTQPSAPTTAPTAAGETPAAPAPAQPAGQTNEHESSAVLEDGRHPVYLTALDITGRTLQFDLVQWLTGDEASEYVEAHPDDYPGLYEEIEELGGYPYDQLVVNDNARLRMLPIAADPQIVVIQTEGSVNEPHTVQLADLPAYLTTYGVYVEGEGWLSPNVFWLTVHDGEIVAIEEQFQS